jgi:hypothetical protein
MPGLVPGTHVLVPIMPNAWMAGTNAAMTENNSCSGGSEKPAVVFGRNDSTRVVCSRVSLSRGNARAALQTAALCANGYRFPKRQGKPAFHEFKNG